MVTRASQWKSKTKAGEQEIDLPSGNTALVRQIKPEAFLESGLIPDPMASVIRSAINSKRGLPPSKMDEISQDPKKLAAALEMFDRLLVYCVIEPAVEMPPVCTVEDCGELYTSGEGVHVDRKHPKYHKYQEDERDPEVLYADVVDMEDKQFLFQWSVGGTADVERFRKELSTTVGAVQPGEAVGSKAK